MIDLDELRRRILCPPGYQPQDVEDDLCSAFEELRAAREVVKCANRYTWESEDMDASKMRKALKAYRESVE